MPNVHPLYRSHAAEWREYRLSYEGGREYLDEYVFKHPKEPSEYYRQRLKRAVHPNHMRAVVDTYSAHLYRESIPRTSDSELLQEFWADTDLLGNSADEFYEGVAQLVQRGGRAAVVVDRFDPDGGEAQTRAQEREAGRRPYAYAVDSEDVIDWDVDRLGALQWVVIREPRDVVRSWQEEHPGTGSQYRVWTPDEWILFVEEEIETDDGIEMIRRVLDRGTHPVGEVPVVFVYWGRRLGAQPIADSSLKDLAPMNRRLTNLVSLIDEQIYGIVFSIMAVPRSTYDELGAVDFSVYGAIPYEDDVSNPPHYLSPEVAPIEVIQAQIDKTEDTIRQLAGLGRVNEETKHVQTGIALSYLTMDKDALLSKFGQRMQRLEAKVDEMAARWMQEPAEADRRYPDKFDPLDLEHELNAAMKFASLGFSGEAAIQNSLLAAKARLGPHLDGEELEKVEAGIREQINRGVGAQELQSAVSIAG